MRLKVGVVLAECRDVPVMKRDRINATERCEEHRFLGLVQHEGIVHKTDAGLYVVWLLAWKASPRGSHEGVYKSGVNVDANSAVAKIGNHFRQALHQWPCRSLRSEERAR